MMNVQILTDDFGKTTGVYVPIKEWEMITAIYPEVAFLNTDLPQWEKDIIDQRLAMIAETPSRIRPIADLLKKMQ